MDWEAAENILMKRLTDQSRKHQGDRHGDPLCVYGDQRREPEQKPGEYRGWYNWPTWVPRCLRARCGCPCMLAALGG